ncbi:nucleotide sugar dehydrogenase [Alkalibacterium thalassium]|uniref:UDP-N-acetyl-D-galactosamine dehydrogenase n=1 Tax=Alkalibacterium thalassium TaxID=426701 RepID=A0A1G9GE72_9LACT|nr:nucleotide sugar dehydrogenase [Alkalibacterium thalassium]SDK98998.1 UDP-N-acetyl-D-galactosamine dehydrogenase [Alkalibacterium thalassium]
MSLYNELVAKKEKIALIGLGYVGMPIAVAFAKKVDVIGFDTNKAKVEQYKRGIDPTKEIGNDVIKETSVEFTSDEVRLKEAKFHIVAVPTPVRPDHTPNLQPVEAASRTLGRNLTKGSIVVYESTVYPGVTEDICIPILEEESGMKAGVDFKVGFSPERINPGDKKHTLENIVKVVSGMDKQSLDDIAKTYELVVSAGVHRAASIKVAEASKVIENAQRDVNIAFVNELSMIFDRMDIDTNAVLEAAKTKWNFLPFTPGLVGGHCIGVDPYYLTYRAEQLGYKSQVITAGRRINDEMGSYVVTNVIKQLINADIVVQKARVAILGFTFKENCPDTRNTRVIDIVNELKEYGISPLIVDPQADADEAKDEYGINFDTLEDVKEMDAIIVAVNHSDFVDLTSDDYVSFFKKGDNQTKVLVDIKGILDKNYFKESGYHYWGL